MAEPRKITGKIPPPIKERANPQTLADLNEDPENPREIEDENLEGLQVSMTEFGDLSGIVFNTRTGQLVSGHQRRDGLRKKFGDLPIQRDKDRAWIDLPDGKRFEIRMVDWDAATQRMANIAANNPHIAGHFTRSLQPQLDELRTRQDALFKGLRMDRLAKMIPSKGGTAEDDVPEPPKKPRTKRGDLYFLGEHRLLCGDSTDHQELARLMDGQRAGLMNTDPPYGIAYDDETRIAAESAHDGQQRKSKWDAIQNDDLKDGPTLQGFLENVIKAAVPHLVKNSAFYLWHPMLTQGTFFAAAAAAADILIHRQIIWVKPSLLFGFGDYHWRHELCFYGWRRGYRPEFYGERNQTTVWELKHEVSNGGRVHPTQKPVRLFEIPMENHTREGEICYEPFSGSGSQIIAGERLGRRVFAMELEPGYCDAAVSRWEAFTGKKAKLQEKA